MLRTPSPHPEPSTQNLAPSSVNLSSVTLTLHAGTHADAPRHFREEGKAVEELGLQPYWGRARVVTVESADLVQASDLQSVLSEKPVRLLIRCNPAFSFRSFPSRICAFSPEAADAIGQAGVRLVGIDAPSVDPLESKTLPAHHAFARHRTRILENLNLRGVPDGEYELVALPLRIVDGDASPVRAVLRELD